MNTPDPKHTTDEQIHHLTEGDPAKAFERAVVPSLFAKPSTPHPEHPLAAKLYAKFRPGSAIMTSDDAWTIGHELDNQLARIHELEAEIETKLGEARATVARLVTQIRELRGDDESPPPRTELVGLGRPFDPPESCPMSSEFDEADER